MQQTPNPLFITNSELAQVEAYREEIFKIFKTDYRQYSDKEDFYTNLHTVTRFSIAREFDKEKTIELWRNWIKWYEDYRPDQISESEPIIHKIHTSGKYRFCGKDKSGCPILIIRMKYHIKGLATAEENLRYLLFMIEKGVKLAKEAGTYQLSVIYDRREMADSDDVSKQTMKKFMPILQDYYPQTLKSFYTLGANIVYRALWKIASIFVSKRTQQKIHLLEEVDKLQYFIDKDNLGQEYGGNLNIQEAGKIK